jgi:metal-sulfur cluster biosynthetic enzyme
MSTRAEAVVTALRGVYDPCCAERGISVVDMGLLRAVSIAEDETRIELILTSGWCPFVLDLVTQVKAAVENLPEVDGADVVIVWDEAWSSDRLSEDARRKLQFLPAPSSLPDRDAYVSAHTPEE